MVLPGTHDTASAVVAVPAASPPAERPDWCYISSGTWSLMGVEVPRPVINDQCLRLNFTNEGGVGGTTRLLKNIAGLWLVQECRRVWQQEGDDHGWDDLNRLAAAAKPLASLVDPDDRGVSGAGQHAGGDSRLLPAHRPSDRRKTKAPSFAVRWRAWRCAIGWCCPGWSS